MFFVDVMTQKSLSPQMTSRIGQLGDGTVTPDRIIPVPVIGVAGASGISAGGSHALGIVNGQVYAWGSNNEGQLGLSVIDGTPHHTPVLVPGLSAVTAVAASRNNNGYALGADHTVWAWGRSTVGQVGRATSGRAPQSSPVRVLKSTSSADVLDGAIAVAASNASAAALRADGTVWTWGFNSNGQLGDGSLARRPFAVPVSSSFGVPLTGVSGVTGGTFFFLAAKGDGTAWGWGQNANGQLGNWTATDAPFPVQVTDPGDPADTLQQVAAVAAGGSHALALLTDGGVRSWGSKGGGQLGNGTSTSTSVVPERVHDPADGTGFLIGVTAIFAGGATSMALRVAVGSSDANVSAGYSITTGAQRDQPFIEAVMWGRTRYAPNTLSTFMTRRRGLRSTRPHALRCRRGSRLSAAPPIAG
jgi:alpha-tubulin suppressor-like RCC1 family protein